MEVEGSLQAKSQEYIIYIYIYIYLYIILYIYISIYIISIFKYFYRSPCDSKWRKICMVMFGARAWSSLLTPMGPQPTRGASPEYGSLTPMPCIMVDNNNKYH